MSTQISISPVIKLEVNTTPITGGSAGQILFQTTGNTVGESANLSWNNTNLIFTLGSTATRIFNFRPEDTTGTYGNSCSIRGGNGNGRLDFYSASNITEVRDNVIMLTSVSGPAIQVASYINLNLGGSTRLQVASTTGNILIGTTTDAGYKLDVNGTARVQGSLSLTAGNAINIGNLQALAPNTGNDLMVGFNNSLLTFYTGNNPVGRFFSTGNFAIGTITDAGYRLDVSGTARISGDISTNQYLYGSGLRSGNALFWDQGGIGSTTDGNTFSNSYNLAGAKTLWLRGDSRFAYQTTPASVYYFGARYSGSASTYLPCDFMKLELSGLESWGISSGTNTSNAINIKLNLNYTGGTSTVRGIYYNPTLTSMTGVTHFAFHSTSGRVRFEGLPTSSAGLSSGDIWNDGGTLKIV